MNTSTLLKVMYKCNFTANKSYIWITGRGTAEAAAEKLARALAVHVLPAHTTVRRLLVQLILLLIHLAPKVSQSFQSF